ncbi:MAG: sensor histidine kinase [Lachnospiraceae bacterium]|nr:sensor histidine kinase [Lachnospiraceae bacterium]
MEKGLQPGLLLFFSVFVWIMYGAVFLSDAKNRINQWCLICGLILSLGVFKEFIVDAGVYAGTEVYVLGDSYDLEEMLNSILTAILYYLAMPCVMVFTFYFCRLDKETPKLFPALCVLVFVPAVIFSFVYTPIQTRAIAQAQPDAFRNVAIYNLIYGMISAVLICISLVRERNMPQFAQRRMVVFIVLIPVGYWLITLFGFHLLKLEKLYKLWQGNIIILPVLFLFYVRQLFRDGAWGLRLQKEHFDWTEEESDQAKASSYLLHMIKNETAKIRWCADTIRDQEHPENNAEADIIRRSVNQIDALLQRSSRYEKPVILQCRDVAVYPLFQEIREECLSKWKGQVRIEMKNTSSCVFCDHDHMKEVLTNLTENAIEAMEPGEENLLTFRLQNLSGVIDFLKLGIYAIRISGRRTWPVLR